MMSEKIVEDILVDKNQKADFSMPYDFPIRVYETDFKYKPHGVNGWHWHDEFQFCVVTKGAVCMTVQKKEFTLKKGEGIFINTGVLHMTRAMGGREANYLCINVHPVMFSFFHGSRMEQIYFLPYIKNESFSAVPLRSGTGWQEEILKYQREICRLMAEKGLVYELEVYIQLICLWRELMLNADTALQTEPAVFRHKEIKQIIVYIQTHYREPISLEEIASAVHINKSGCCRLFKQALNCTILDYLTEYRIQKSLALLADTDMSITQIAHDVGFSGVSYFIKKFNTVMHTTPGVYRKR